MSLPVWMTKELIESTLVNYLQNKSVRVVDIISKFAVPVGDNYCSDLFRLTVKYTTSENDNKETISLIAKIKPETGAKQMLTNEIPVFEKESEMFNITLKKLHQLLGKNCLSADCLHAEVGTHGWLILQDLAPLGYVMTDRKAGLDINHTLIVLNKVAKMHASSAVLYEKEPDSMAFYNTGMYTNQSGDPLTTHFCNSGVQSLVLAVSKWQGFTQYASKLSAVADDIFERTVKAAERRAGFNVLNHGDLWINNILFKYDSNGDPDDCKFVDFQFSVFTSPAIDLQYFIYTSVKHDIERTQLNRLLEYYYDELVKQLKKLNYPKDKIPTLEWIRKDFFDRSLCGFTAAVTILPIVKAPPRKDATFEELFKSDDKDAGFRQTSYNEPDYRSIMEKLLPYFEKLGLMNK